MRPGVKQAAFMRHPGKRINIADGSVRSGKTHIFNFKWIEYCARGPTGAPLLMVGKTSDTLKRNIIAPLQDLLGDELEYKAGSREAYLWDRTMHCIGANDERAEQKIRGMTVAGVLGDEISLWPESFFKMMLSRMSIPGAQFFGTTNPDTPGHYLKKDYLDREDELDLKRWQFRLDDNPSLDPKFVENLKKEYAGLFYKRFIDGLWVLAEGAIYDFFDEEIYVIPAPPGIAQYYLVGVDYGIGNPTAFVKIGVNELLWPRMWCESEYYYDARATGHQKTDVELSQDFKQWLGSDIHRTRGIYIDPSALSLIVQFRRDGISQIKEADNDVLNGINTQARLLKNGDYRICRNCKQTIEDYGAYVWDEKASEERGEDKPIKKFDHTKDAERYPLYTVFGRKTYDINKMNQ